MCLCWDHKKCSKLVPKSRVSSKVWWSYFSILYCPLPPAWDNILLYGLIELSKFSLLSEHSAWSKPDADTSWQILKSIKCPEWKETKSPWLGFLLVSWAPHRSRLSVKQHRRVSPVTFALGGLHRFNAFGFKPGLRWFSAISVQKQGLCSCDALLKSLQKSLRTISVMSSHNTSSCYKTDSYV